MSKAFKIEKATMAQNINSGLGMILSAFGASAIMFTQLRTSIGIIELIALCGGFFLMMAGSISALQAEIKRLRKESGLDPYTGEPVKKV